MRGGNRYGAASILCGKLAFKLEPLTTIGEKTKMYHYNDLRAERFITTTHVPCPVKGCSVQVERQKGRYQKADAYKCPKHDIYITPAVFEYGNYENNLLCFDKDDEALLESIFGEKRESRLAREKSEDAVTWNVFRYIEKKDLLKSFLDSISSSGNEDARLIYWSFDQNTSEPYAPLVKAREEFGEKSSKGSEPDLIIEAKGNIYFVTTKLESGNKTTPSNPDNKKKYEIGGSNWFSEVFRSGSDFEKVASKESFYELMRLWLLGTWIANEHLNRDFFLVNLVLNRKDRDIEYLFGRHINSNESRAFKRLSWEQIYSLIERIAPVDGKKEIVEYFHGKTLGYINSGILQRAFSV